MKVSDRVGIFVLVAVVTSVVAVPSSLAAGCKSKHKAEETSKYLATYKTGVGNYLSSLYVCKKKNGDDRDTGAYEIERGDSTTTLSKVSIKGTTLSYLETNYESPGDGSPDTIKKILSCTLNLNKLFAPAKALNYIEAGKLRECSAK